MVSFQCDGCTDVVKKPKLDQHRGRCGASFTCIDCSKTFPTPADWKGHISCISEDQKYQKSLYKPKGGNVGRGQYNGAGRGGRGGFHGQSGSWGRPPTRSQATGANDTPLGTPTRMSPVIATPPEQEERLKAAPSTNGRSAATNEKPTETNGKTATTNDTTPITNGKSEKPHKKRKSEVVEVSAESEVKGETEEKERKKKEKKEKKKREKAQKEGTAEVNGSITPVADAEAMSEEKLKKSKKSKKEKKQEAADPADAETTAQLTATGMNIDVEDEGEKKKKKKKRKSEAVDHGAEVTEGPTIDIPSEGKSKKRKRETEPAADATEHGTTEKKKKKKKKEVAS